MRTRLGIAVVFAALGLMALLWSLATDTVPLASSEVVIAERAAPRASAPPVLSADPIAWPPADLPSAESGDATPEGYVRCPLVTPVPVEGEVEFVLTIDETESSVTFAQSSATLRDGHIELPIGMASLRRGKITVPGYLPVDVSWTEDDGGARCEPIELRAGAIVVGTVTPAGGVVYVRGCGGFASVDPDGQFYLEAEIGPCELAPERREEPFTTHGRAVAIETSPDEETAPRRSQASAGATSS